MHSLSKDGVIFKKQDMESLFSLSMEEPFHHSSFNLLNWKSSLLNITPAKHKHFGVEGQREVKK